MNMKRIVASSAAALTVTVSSVLLAETPPNPASEAMGAQGPASTPVGTPAVDKPTGPAQEYKETKVDEATAADARYHANPTEANRQARDKTEADAAAAAGMPHPEGQLSDR